MMYQIIKNNNTSMKFTDKWNSETEIISAIQGARDRKTLEQDLLKII